MLVLSTDVFAQDRGATFPWLSPDPEQSMMLANAFAFQMQLFLGAAGVGDGSLSAVRLLAMFAAMIGALLIIFFPKYQKMPVIGTWLLLVVIALFVPVGSQLLFQPLKADAVDMIGYNARAVPTQDGSTPCPTKPEGCGFAPQLLAVHMGSVIQTIASDIFRSTAWAGLIERQTAATELYTMADEFNLGSGWIGLNRKYTDARCDADIADILDDKPTDADKATTQMTFLDAFKGLETYFQDKSGNFGSIPYLIVLPRTEADAEKLGWIKDGVRDDRILDYEAGIAALCNVFCKASKGLPVYLTASAGAVSVADALDEMKTESKIFDPQSDRTFSERNFSGFDEKPTVGSGFFMAPMDASVASDILNTRKCFVDGLESRGISYFEHKSDMMKVCLANSAGGDKGNPESVANTYNFIKKRYIDMPEADAKPRSDIGNSWSGISTLLLGEQREVKNVFASMPVGIVTFNPDKKAYGSNKFPTPIANEPEDGLSCFTMGKQIVNSVIRSLETKHEPKTFDNLVGILDGSAVGDVFDRVPSEEGKLRISDVSSETDIKENDADRYRLVSLMAVRMGEALRNIDKRKVKAGSEELALRAAMVNSLVELMSRVTTQATGANYGMGANAAIDGRRIEPKLVGIDVLTDWGGDLGFNLGKIIAKIGAWFTGPLAAAFIQFLTVLVDFTLMVLITITPLLFIFGLLIPTAAAGVLTIAVMSVFILKFVPVTLIILNGVGGMVYDLLPSSVGINAGFTRDLLVLAMGGLYMNLVGLTFFLMFKLGDPAAFLGRLTALDGSAKQLADRGIAAAMAVASVAGVATLGAVGGAFGAFAAKGSKLQKLGESMKDNAVGKIAKTIDPYTAGAGSAAVAGAAVTEKPPLTPEQQAAEDAKKKKEQEERAKAGLEQGEDPLDKLTDVSEKPKYDLPTTDSMGRAFTPAEIAKMESEEGRDTMRKALQDGRGFSREQAAELAAGREVFKDGQKHIGLSNGNIMSERAPVSASVTPKADAMGELAAKEKEAADAVAAEKQAAADAAPVGAVTTTATTGAATPSIATKTPVEAGADDAAAKPGSAAETRGAPAVTTTADGATTAQITTTTEATTTSTTTSTAGSAATQVAGTSDAAAAPVAGAESRGAPVVATTADGAAPQVTSTAAAPAAGATTPPQVAAGTDSAAAAPAAGAESRGAPVVTAAAAGGIPAQVTVMGGSLDGVGTVGTISSAATTSAQDRLDALKAEQKANDILQRETNIDNAAAVVPSAASELNDLKSRAGDMSHDEFNKEFDKILQSKGSSASLFTQRMNMNQQLADRLDKIEKTDTYKQIDSLLADSGVDRTDEKAVARVLKDPQLIDFKKRYDEMKATDTSQMTIGALAQHQGTVDNLQAALDQRAAADAKPGFWASGASGLYGALAGSGGGLAKIPVLGPALTEALNEFQEAPERARAWKASGGAMAWREARGDAARAGFYNKAISHVAAAEQYQNMGALGGFQAQKDLAVQAAREAVERTRAQGGALNASNKADMFAKIATEFTDKRADSIMKADAAYQVKLADMDKQVDTARAEKRFDDVADMLEQKATMMKERFQAAVSDIPDAAVNQYVENRVKSEGFTNFDERFASHLAANGDNALSRERLSGLGRMDAADRLVSVRQEAALMQKPSLLVKAADVGLDGNMLLKEDATDPRFLATKTKEVAVALTPDMLNRFRGDLATKKHANSFDDMMIAHYGLAEKQYLRGDAAWNSTRNMNTSADAAATFARKDVSTDYLIGGHLKMVQGKERFMESKGQYETLVKFRNESNTKFATEMAAVFQKGGQVLADALKDAKIGMNVSSVSQLSVDDRAKMEKWANGQLKGRNALVPLNAIFDEAASSGAAKYELKSKVARFNIASEQAEVWGKTQKAAAAAMSASLADVQNFSKKIGFEVNGVKFDIGSAPERLFEKFDTMLGDRAGEAIQLFNNFFKDRQDAIKIGIEGKDENKVGSMRIDNSAWNDFINDVAKHDREMAQKFIQERENGNKNGGKNLRTAAGSDDLEFGRVDVKGQF